MTRGTQVRDLDDPTRTGRVTDITHIDSGYVTVKWADERKPQVEHTDNLEPVQR